MGTVSYIRQAKFAVGDVIEHRLFDYRGVVVDVDASFQLSEEWYRQMALSRPPKNRPWYHVLVDGALHNTYVAEQNLQPDTTAEPVLHPLVDRYFARFDGQRYITHERPN